MAWKESWINPCINIVSSLHLLCGGSPQLKWQSKQTNCFPFHIRIWGTECGRHRSNVWTVRESDGTNMALWFMLDPEQLNCYAYDLVQFIVIVIYRYQTALPLPPKNVQLPPNSILHVIPMKTNTSPCSLQLAALQILAPCPRRSAAVAPSHNHCGSFSLLFHSCLAANLQLPF